MSELRHNGVQGFQTVRPMRGRRLDIYTRPEEQLAVAGVQPLYGLRMPRHSTGTLRFYFPDGRCEWMGSTFLAAGFVHSACGLFGDSSVVMWPTILPMLSAFESTTSMP